MNVQLPLGISLPEYSSFDNFIVGGNEVALGLCQAMAGSKGDQQVYIWGEAGVGKTHLLQAACSLVASRGGTVSYLPMQDVHQYGPDILEGLEGVQLVCLDDLEYCATEAWQFGLFALINACRDTGARLLVSAADSPVQSSLFTLPDLNSRLAWGAVVQLKALDDADKLKWLQWRAESRGLSLSADLARYLLCHYPRDMHSLNEAVKALDKASLVAQRPLTLPFIKEVLSH